MKRIQRVARATLAIAGVTFLSGAKSKCGSEEANTTLTSPVQAVATLLRRSDGTVEAELALISTKAAPARFVDSATNVRLRVPGGALVPLELAESGHYRASSATSPALVYQGGQRYQLTFELLDQAAAGDVAGGSFVAAVTTPADLPVTLTVSAPPAFAGDKATFTWTPAALSGMFTIRDGADAIAYSSFDLREPHFDGSKWARLGKPPFNLSAGVLTAPGTYTVSLCAVTFVRDFDTDLSPDLGVGSGFVTGTCAADQTITVVP